MPERRRPPTDEAHTEVYDPASGRSRVAEARDDHEPTEKTGAPTQPVTDTKSQPLTVISMKTPAELTEERRKRSARIIKPKIRSLGEISGTHTPPQGLGFLAPPRNAAAARTKRTRSNTLWVLLGLGIAAVVGVSVWLVAAR